MQLILRIFEDENQNRLRSVNIGGEPWFVANDICASLDYKNPRDAIARHVDSEDVVKHDTPTDSGSQSMTYINESGLYALIFGSKLESAKKFKRWVTREVLPQIRKTGSYSLTSGHSFVRRFNDNWDRTSPGHFSVISELYIRLYGRFEQVGHIIPDKANDGVGIRPDNSVGRLFSDWLKRHHEDKVATRSTYSHLLPNGLEIEAFQYPRDILPLFIEYVEDIWLRERAPIYLKDRDPRALEYLPKLLPPPQSK